MGKIIKDWLAPQPIFEKGMDVSMDQSNIDDAFQLIDRVLGSASIKINGEAITRMDHAALQQALQLLVTAAKDNQENEDNGGTE